jgi:carbonic anhydrase/acetyltransferase-like protein (isoleucine patch superfamily)
VIDPAARIHPSADLERDVSVGAGSSVWQRAQIRAGARIGAECIVGRDAFIDEGVTIADPWHCGDPGPFRAIVTQTADGAFAGLEAAWFPDLRVVYDGRNSLRDLALPDGVAYVGVDAQASTRRLEA